MDERHLMKKGLHGRADEHSEVNAGDLFTSFDCLGYIFSQIETSLSVSGFCL